MFLSLLTHFYQNILIITVSFKRLADMPRETLNNHSAVFSPYYSKFFLKIFPYSSGDIYIYIKKHNLVFLFLKSSSMPASYFLLEALILCFKSYNWLPWRWLRCHKSRIIVILGREYPIHRWFSKEQRCHFHVNLSKISKQEKWNERHKYEI